KNGRCGRTPMKPRAARRRLFSLLNAYGGELGLLTIESGLELMARFYRHDRCRGCDPAAGHDMLFCAWGSREWRRSERFVFLLSRRLIDAEKRGPSIRELQLAFLYEPTDQLKSLGRGSVICERPGETASFTTTVTASEAYAMVSGYSHRDVELFFGPVRVT